jgi:hypothetical protein
MTPWLLLILTGVFAYLGYDAFKLIVPPAAIPYSVTAKGLGQDVSHLTLAEQEPLKKYNRRYGLGNLNQSVWFFAILTFGCAVATAFAFIQ